MTREQVERYICDRCGAIAERFPNIVTRPEQWNTMTLSGDGSEYDLCQECARTLHRWLDGFSIESLV